MATTDNSQHLKTDPLRSFRFLVSIAPPATAGTASQLSVVGGFSEVGGLTASAEVINYREGGMNATVRKLPGMVDFGPITLSRGLLAGRKEAWDWFKTIFSVNYGGGFSGDFRCNFNIDVLSHPSANNNPPPAMVHYYVYNAWCSAISYTDMNAQSGGIMVESMQIQHEGFDAVFV